MRSKDKEDKKHLAKMYTEVVELLLSVSDKKTQAAGELRNYLTTENFDKMVKQFTSIDRLCHSILQHCPKPSSTHAVADVAQHLDTALKRTRLASERLSVVDNERNSNNITDF